MEASTRWTDHIKHVIIYKNLCNPQNETLSGCDQTDFYLNTTRCLLLNLWDSFIKITFYGTSNYLIFLEEQKVWEKSKDRQTDISLSLINHLTTPQIYLGGAVNSARQPEANYWKWIFGFEDLRRLDYVFYVYEAILHCLDSKTSPASPSACGWAVRTKFSFKDWTSRS